MSNRIFKQQLAITLSLCLLLSSFLTPAEGPTYAAEAEQVNLIQNGGFEEVNEDGLAEQWRTYTFSGQLHHRVDDEVVKEGSHSYKISADVNSRGTVIQTAELTEEQQGKTYTLQQWIKTENLTGKAYFRIQAFDSDGGRFHLIESDKITGTNDWTLIEFDVPLHEKVVRIQLESFLENGTGTVWFDETAIFEKVEFIPQNLITNGSFEITDEEGMAENWSTYTYNGSPAYSVDDVVYQEGERSFKMSAETVSRALVKQSFPLSNEHRGKTFKVQQWVKTEDILSTGRTYARVQIYDENNQRIGALLESTPLRGTNDWTLLERVIEIPQSGASILWEGFLENSTGTVWFDDIRIFEWTEDETPAEPGVMLQNGDFEQVTDGKPDRWGTYTFTGTPTYELDQSVYRSESHAYKIHADSHARGVITQSNPVTADQRGKTYRLEYWIKTEDLTANAFFRIQFRNEQGVRTEDLIYGNAITGTNDWTMIEVMFDIPMSAHSLLWEGFFENGTGTVWYDDLHFFEWIGLDELHLNEDDIHLDSGDSYPLTLEIIPEHTTEQLIWNSSDESVATVQGGVVEAHSNGIAVISVTSSSSRKTDFVVVFVGEFTELTVPDYNVSVQQDRFVEGTVVGEGEAGATLNYHLAAAPATGIAYVKVDGDWSYYPDDTYAGEDRFAVIVQDEDGAIGVSIVHVDVLAAPQPPVLETVIQPTDKNTPVSGEIPVLEANGNTLTFTVDQAPQHGQVDMTADGDWTYTPDVDYTGDDRFIARVTNEHGQSATALVRTYVAPSAEEIFAELKAANPGERQPRILATNEDFDRMRTGLANGDERLTEWFENVRASADGLLNQPPYDYVKPDGLRLDKTAANRITTLAFVYQLTQDPVYLDRAWVEFEHVASDAYPDWSPEHFLDTAGMTHGVALGYDWLYNDLTEEQRAVIRESIATKGLQPAVPMYIDKTYWWVYNRDNWNFVSNAAMVMGALAIAEDEEELAGLILREAFKSIQYGLPQYAPDGSAIEGPAYWEYGTMSLVYFLSALETSFGHNFGFSAADGIADTPEYPIYITGPNGSFNHSDNADSFVPGRLLLWFANHYNKPEYAWYHQFVTEKGSNPGLYDMLWYRSDIYGETEPNELDRQFDLPKAVTMRSDWSDPNALFVGFKGGVNGAPHGDLDSGTFVFDANGVRWALDVGNEDYNLPGYWGMDQNSARWHYYRKNTQGHNTLAIESSLGFNQNTHTVSEIVKTEFHRPEGSFAIADLTPAYKESAASVKRGTALLNHRREFLVQDEVKLKTPSDLYWFMHTRAEIELDQSGTTAILSQQGRQLAVQLVSPADASFSVLPAEALPNTPNPDGQTRNLGVQKLTVHLEDALEETISVRMVPLMLGETVSDPAPVVPLDEWEIEESELALLDGISLDGEALSSFAPTRYVYDVEKARGDDHVPAVTAQASEAHYDVTIQAAESIPGVARIEVTDPTGVREDAVYTIYFDYPYQIELPSEDQKIIPVGVTASEHDGNIPENTLDGNLSTRWSAEGEQWIAYDLGDVYDVEALSIAWYQGNVRQSYFHIELSEDGENWEKVYEGLGSGQTSDLEGHFFTATPVQHVRIRGFGNSQNQWNSISEVGIYQAVAADEPVFESVGEMLDVVEGSKEEFATELAYRAVRTHLTALSHFENQGNAEKVMEHLAGFIHLLNHQNEQELISATLYDLLREGASTLGQ